MGKIVCETHNNITHPIVRRNIINTRNISQSVHPRDIRRGIEEGDEHLLFYEGLETVSHVRLTNV